MSPRNRNITHDRALDLLVARDTQLSEQEEQFLQMHLDTCEPCTAQSDAINALTREMRGTSVYANPKMVRATQMRVRARAAEMRQQQDTMRPLWISSALALGWAVVSMPVLWQGFAWLGHTTRLPDLVWQSGFGIMALAPITAVATIGLASRFHNKATS
jgi:hypothetical protein